MDNDELLIYRGKDYHVSKYINIHQPTLDEISDFGEIEYFSMIKYFTFAPIDMSWQLYDSGVDFTEISDFKLFYDVLIYNLTLDKTKILFGDLDFSKFQLGEKKTNKEICLVQCVNSELVIIDEYTYTVISNYIRSMHNLKRNNRKPANEGTKLALIEDARELYMINKDNKYTSYLKNMISALTNCSEFKFNHNNVWDMKINAFMDSALRIQKIKNANLLLQSGYSGTGIDLKKINKKDIDWMGEL